jgi:Peptidase family S41
MPGRFTFQGLIGRIGMRLNFSLSLFFRQTLLIATSSTFIAAHAYDAAKWREDFAQARSEMAQTYANLDRMVSERKLDLKALVSQTELKLAKVGSNEDAARALSEFLAAFGDGHVRMLPALAVSPTASPPVAAAAPAPTCQELGYRARTDTPIAFSRLGEYDALENADSALLPAGVLRAGGKSIGVIRIALFSEDAFPSLCEKLRRPDTACDAACKRRLFTQVGKELTRVLTRQVRALSARKIDALAIDITGNGGGTNWAEAAARVVTGPGIAAPRIAFIKHPHWVKSIGYRISDIEQDLKRADLPVAQRLWLTDARTRMLEARELAAQPCPREGIWENRAVCPLLVSGHLHTVGIDATPPELNFDGYAAEWVHNNLASYEATSTWQGPVAVVMDRGTASAAELFAATLKDNGRAVLIGEPTLGSGCGFTNGGIPITLKHSGARIRVPDCARLRADGSNEVAGLVPDIVANWRSGDSTLARATQSAKAIGVWAKGLPSR